MFGRLRFRGKLALVVAVPLVAMTLLTLPSVFNAVDRLQRAEEIGRSMQVANRVTALAFELQQERLLSLGYLLDVVDRGQLVTGTARVDDRLADLHHAAERGELRDAGLPAPALSAVAAAEDLIARRDAVLSRSMEAEQLFGEYSTVIDQLIASLQLLKGADLATPAARHVAVLEASLGMNEISAQAGNLLVIIAGTESFLAGIMYAAVLSPMGDYFDQYVQYATREQQVLRDEMEQAYIERDSTGEGVALGLDPYQVTAGQSVDNLFRDIQSLGQLARFLEGKIITDVLIEVESQRQSALRNVYLIALGGLLAVLLVVAVTAALTRTVLRPLLGLTDSANRVAVLADAELARIADDESALLMPQPIRIDQVHVKARDEIGDLGRAFERVQEFAIQLVERQMASRRNIALMLGYLGRRTQNLVGRQLDLVDSLERNETDTERLASLYRLDHVSSRLRRNADSLVVLSGASGPDEFTTPLALTDVVRLALGQIEAYERVDVDVPPEIAVVPALISDLVLVLAELMENATGFSPPHTRVSVSAIATGNRGPDEQVVEVLVVDHGIGLPTERRAEENARLAHRERLDLAPTEVLGLFVVGRLARRHGLGVTLSETAGGGVTAVVGLYREHLLPRGSVDNAIVSRTSGERTLETPAPADQPPEDPDVALLPERWARPSGPALEQPGGAGVAVLRRAVQVLETGQPWNGFAVPPAAAPEGPEGPEPAPAIGVASLPRTPGGAHGLAGLRQRVPGATLESSLPRAGRRPGQPAPDRQPGTPSAAADPAQARELVEQLESGVLRALSELESRANWPDAGTRGEPDDQ
jgi:hypothetical protein